MATKPKKDWVAPPARREGTPMTREDYAKRGLIHQQGEMFPGTNPPPALSKWESMHPDKQKEVSDHLEKTYGITMDNAIHNHGVLIDSSVNTTGESGRHFYSGGTEDHRDKAGKDQLVETSQRHGISTNQGAYVRAALSPRSNVHDEVSNMDKVLSTRDQTEHPKVTGLAGKQNVIKARAVLEHDSVHPEDTRQPGGTKSFGTRTTEKISSYAQSYTHPHHADVRTAVDTHAVGGMAPHLPKTAPAMGTGKFDAKGKEFKKPVPMSHPDWVPNQEDALSKAGTYEFFDHAQRKAAEARGLEGPEGQSLAWHAERSARASGVQPGTGRGRTGKGKAVAEADTSDPAQSSLFNDRRSTPRERPMGR